MEKNLLQEIARWLFIILLLLIVVGSSLIQYFSPEYFLLQDLRTANFLKHNYLEEDPLTPPYELCDRSGCRWENLPTHQPYITKTRWWWVYEYQTEMIWSFFVIGVLLNWDKVKLWKRKIMSSN